MVGVGQYGCRSALARVTIISWDYDIVLDTYVKVNEPVTDFRTFVSGIRPYDIISEKAMPLKQVQQLVKSIIRDKILVGHGLRSDLEALGLKHPWYAMRDTARYTPYMTHSTNPNAVPRSRKLRDLATDKLGILIQETGQAHCPIEDAVTALQLYKLAQNEWEDLIQWKIHKTREIETYKIMKRREMYQRRGVRMNHALHYSQYIHNENHCQVYSSN